MQISAQHYYCMKTISFLTAILFTCLGFAQTKKETIDWINAKSPKNPVVFGGTFPSSQRLIVNQDGTFKITINDYEFPLDTQDPKIQTTTTLSGDFKDFNPSSVTIRRIENLIFIDIECYNSKNCITISQVGRKGITYDQNSISFGAYNSSEANIADRLKKAFKSLISLCGGKNEAY